MKVLFDIGHPAHIHFFRNPISLLKLHGHEVFITSREKEFTLRLLTELGLQHQHLSSSGTSSLISLGKELIKRNITMLHTIKKTKPNIMAAIGGVSIAHMTRLTGIPSLVFYDTENAKLQNLITYPFASQVIVPRCYSAWLPKNRHIRYAGYHELSYLHPSVFKAKRDIAISNGLAENGDTFFIRVVSWKASHDIGEKGWSQEFLEKIVLKLSALGKVVISSESLLTDNLAKYAYQGKLSEVHHVLAFCKAFIGESATMASECAVLGVPAIYAAETGRGYTDEQERLYGLVKNLRKIEWRSLEKSVNDILEQPNSTWQFARQHLLNDTINVAEFVTDCIESYPNLATMNQNTTDH